MIYKHFISKISKFCLILFLIFISQNCSKDNEAYVPNVPVYYSLNLLSELASLGVSGFVTITPSTASMDYSVVDYHKNNLTFNIPQRTYGNGIIVFRKDVSEYQAFDITCSYKGLEDHCSVTGKAGDLLVTCPCCSSQFLLSGNGYPTTKSVATRPLLQYNCYIGGNGMQLIVSR